MGNNETDADLIQMEHDKAEQLILAETERMRQKLKDMRVKKKPKQPKKSKSEDEDKKRQEKERLIEQKKKMKKEKLKKAKEQKVVCDKNVRSFLSDFGLIELEHIFGRERVDMTQCAQINDRWIEEHIVGDSEYANN